MRPSILTAALILAAPAGGALAAEDDLLPPVRLEAAGKPVDTEEPGHSAPFVVDWDGDGKRDLLVGQFGGGALWIYRNEGTDAAPRLGPGTKFKDGRKEGTVPTG